MDVLVEAEGEWFHIVTYKTIKISMHMGGLELTFSSNTMPDARYHIECFMCLKINVL